MKVKIIVTPKKTVLDPQGKAVEGSLHRLGYAEAQNVRVGKYIEFSLESADSRRAKDRVDEMCRKLLANPLIEDVRYEFES